MRDSGWLLRGLLLQVLGRHRRGKNGVRYIEFYGDVASLYSTCIYWYM